MRKASPLNLLLAQPHAIDATYAHACAARTRDAKDLLFSFLINAEEAVFELEVRVPGDEAQARSSILVRSKRCPALGRTPWTGRP